MGKNNYVIQYEKRLAKLRNKVIIDSAYIGAGFVITLFNRGFSDDEIVEIMNEVNETWTDIRDKRKNPMKYCYELTGFEVITDEQEKQIIEEYFREAE